MKNLLSFTAESQPKIDYVTKQTFYSLLRLSPKMLKVKKEKKDNKSKPKGL